MKHSPDIAQADAHRGIGIGEWIMNHDEKRAFIVLYIGLALVLSIAISLFWLVIVVGIHFGFEVFRHSRLGDSRWLPVLARASWEVLLDIGLIFFAIGLALYIDVIFGIVGIGAAARTGTHAVARAGARFAAWQRAIRGVLLSLDDVVQIGRSFRSSKRDSNEEVGEKPVTRWGGWNEKWTRSDRLCLTFTTASILLVALSPFLSPHALPEILGIMATELHPFP